MWHTSKRADQPEDVTATPDFVVITLMEAAGRLQFPANIAKICLKYAHIYIYIYTNIFRGARRGALAYIYIHTHMSLSLSLLIHCFEIGRTKF